MTVKRFLLAFVCVIAFCAYPIGHAVYKGGGVTEKAALAANAWVASLNDSQKSTAVMSVESPERQDWQIIPKDKRKGLQLNQMTESQRQGATVLLRSVLSEIGYRKSTQIMNMENLLKELEAGKTNSPLRDSTRYYFTVFGTPQAGKRWGLSIEGHHMSLNFLMDGDRVVSSTPQAFAANPAIVRTENKAGVAVGTRMLRLEETSAFELIQSLSDQQRAVAVIAEKAPRENRTLGVQQPPKESPVGIPYSKLSPPQQALLKDLVNEYINAAADEVAEDRRQAIQRTGGWDAIHFSWEGALQPGVGHAYRVQGPSFLIEFVNTQPDVAGNIANHIHSIWRDSRGDFGVTL